MIEVPSVSVVVPLYNKEKYICRCLGSILKQTMPDFEALIVDDGSTDGSAAVVEPWLSDKRFRLIQQQNAGEGAARNRGLREAAGRIITFLDADDEWLPGHLQSITDLARLFPTAGFFATGYRSIHHGGFSVLCTINSQSPCLINEYYSLASSGNGVHISTVAIRRFVAASTLMFSENEPLGADQEFYISLALITPLAYDPRISSIYHHDVQGNVMGSVGWRGALPLTARRLVECLETDQVPHNLRSSAQKHLAWILEQHALAGIASGHKAEALELLKQASGLDDQGKKRLARLRNVLNWVPESLCRIVIRFRRSRWGLIIPSLQSIRRSCLGLPQVRNKIDWSSCLPGRN